MTDPTRLIDDDVSEFERMLLDSGQAEQPAPHLKAQMLAGAGTAAVATTSTFGNSTRWLLGIGLAGGALLAGGIWFASESNEAPLASQASAPVAVTLPSPMDDAEAEPVAVAVAPTQPKEIAPKSQPTPAPTQKSSAAGQAKGSSITAEVALLERARGALSAGDSASALSLVKQYHRRFPSGALAQEATVIEVKALKLRGDTGRADQLTDEFIEKHPDSAHRKRLEDKAPEAQ